jgi:hypothetical protein
MREWKRIFREWIPITHSFIGAKVSILNELCHKVDDFASRAALFFCYSQKTIFITLVKSNTLFDEHEATQQHTVSIDLFFT